MNKKLEQLIESLKENLGPLLSISFGVFLFVLFFQPFPLESSDFNNLLLIVAGMAGIVFLSMIIVRILVPWIVRSVGQELIDPLFPPAFNGFIITVLNSVSFAFFIRYVGSVTITFFITFKAVIIGLIPAIVMGLYDSYRNIKDQNLMLIAEKRIIQKQIEKYEEDILNKSIEFISENIAENFSLLIGEVAYIRSADNYVEIIYREGDSFKSKLIRNTLRNIELQIKQYTNFLRCHRTCIVNVHFIEKLHRTASNHYLKIKGSDEQVPVSRQYLLKLQEAI